MIEPIKYRRPAAFMHTGKHDYDDGMRVSSNAARKRTMRVLKRRQRRQSMQWALQD